jgi:soluble lytic murein transglycosylase
MAHAPAVMIAHAPLRFLPTLQGVVVGLVCVGGSPSLGWAADADVLNALQSAERRDVPSLVIYSASMQDSVLAYYPEYLRLNIDLAQQPVESIVSFAKRYAGSALAEKLSADYAEARAKQGDDAAVRQVAAFISNPDLSESCAVAQAQFAGGDALALSSLREPVWLATAALPDACQRVAMQLLTSPMITAADRQQRLWALLRSNQRTAAVTVANVMGLALNAEQLATVAATPEAQIQSGDYGSPSAQALYVLALGRLAERSVEAAANAHAAVASQLPADLRRYGYRILAMNTTGRAVVNNGFDPRTVLWFDQSVGLAWSDEEADAYARHAVRMGEWESILRALDGMSFNSQQKRDWQYWFARASEQRADPRAKSIAQAFYRSLAVDTDYYGLLARDRLGLRTTTLDPMYQPTDADRARMRQDIHFKRAFALRDAGVPATWATREWNWAVRQASQKQDDGLILAAAEQADRIDWHDRAIYATERTTRLFNDVIRYPTPYRDQVVRYSAQVQLDPAWAYGLMRQESRFVHNARSGVGAGGLMQIMPTTGKWIAGRLGEPFSQSRLTEMDTNIRYGTFYLSHILQQLNNQPVLATAGYNAGPTRAKRWQPANAPLSSDQYTESIPFLETRDYVKNVMTNALHYSLLFGQKEQSLLARMGDIPVRGDASIEGP